jgi:DnaJ like chaperone protein
MNLWRSITGHAKARPDTSGCTTCPEGLPDQDAQFSAAVTALGAKLAKADGEADPGEFVAFSEVFVPEPGAARDVRRLYDLARQTTRGFESYARQIAKRYRACPQVLEEVLAGLFHVAKADGVVTDDELKFLERVAELFNISPMTWRRIRAEQIGAPADDAYVILGVAPDAPDAEIHAAWKRALMDLHPDRAVALGRSLQDTEAAQARAAVVNAAHDQVMRERNAWAAAELT